MTRHETIESKLRDAFAPAHLEVVNESGMHNVEPGSETHFRVVVVAAAFEGKTRVERHRMIYALLEQERAEGLHALGIQTLTPTEFGPHPRIESPPCLGDAGAAGGESSR